MIRTYEAGVGVMIMLVALLQFVMLSAGRLGEQWDSTSLDVEVKKALEGFQTIGVSDSLEKYSKIRDPDLIHVPQSESVGYRILVNGEPVDKTVPPMDVEVAATDARMYHESRDAPRLVRTFWERLLRSEYVQEAGRTMDHDSIDELADIVLGLLWDPESNDIVEERVSIIIDNQNDDGGWGFVKDEESDSLCTSMAVRSISAWISSKSGDPLSNGTVTAGISWLKNRVHADGGYGGRERLESTVDMTSHALLAFTGAGLTTSDPWVRAARNYVIRLQMPDGGFPLTRRGNSQPSSTALALEALIAVNASQALVESGLDYLGTQMTDDGNFTVKTIPVGGTGTYDLTVRTGYIVDCSPRGHEFWGSTSDDSIVNIVDVYGDRNNMTVVLSIERGRLDPPDNKQKVALCFSHNTTPDTTDWWILNAGNPHTSGGGRQIDSPQFQQDAGPVFTILTITDLVVPVEYDFFTGVGEDWLLAVVGDDGHPIKDNMGRGYMIGYWGRWQQIFPFSDILAWRSFSPKVNRVCLDFDTDMEFDDVRLTAGDNLTYRDSDWQLGIVHELDQVNLSFRNEALNYTRYFYPVSYNLTTQIPEPKSGLYHFGIMSRANKPSLTKNYKVVLRDAIEEGVYDEAYIWNGTQWNMYLDGMTFNDSGNLYTLGIEDDFIILTSQNEVTYSGLSGLNVTSLIVEGDFIQVQVDRSGPAEVWMYLYHEGEEIDRSVFAEDLPLSIREIFGTWDDVRETSQVYHMLGLAEDWLTDDVSTEMAHDVADSAQLALKFMKVFNSVIEDKLSIHAWYKSD